MKKRACDIVWTRVRKPHRIWLLSRQRVFVSPPPPPFYGETLSRPKLTTVTVTLLIHVEWAVSASEFIKGEESEERLGFRPKVTQTTQP